MKTGTGSAPRQSVALALLGLLTLSGAEAGMFPETLTTNSDVFAVLRYPCPFPDSINPPVIRRDNSNLTMEATTLGTVCFDGETPRDYAYNLGRLQAGHYKMTVQHRYRLGNNQPSEFFWTNAVVREFDVIAGIPDNLSGVWSAVGRERDGFNIVVNDPQSAYVTWNTNGVDGKPLWLFGLLTVSGSTLQGTMYMNKGLRFGDARPAQGDSSEVWGNLQLQLQGCGSLRASWVSQITEFGTGNAQLTQLVVSRGVDGCEPNAYFAYGSQPLPIN